MKTTVLLDHEPVADGGWYVRALLRIEGDAPKDDQRTPLNIGLVLDRSGSMAGEPLRAAIRAGTMLVRRLSMEDMVSVVAYDHEVEVVAPPATGEAQEDLIRRMSEIEARGTTNLSGGWLRGCDLVGRAKEEGGVNRIVLLTDGLANQGITDPEQLIGLTRSAAAGGITTTTIGFGPQFDEDLLRAMADAGRGGAYYIEKTDQASGIFEEELEGVLSLAAQNVRLEVRPGADADFIQVLHDYPSHGEGDALTVEIGDLYAREPRKVLLEFLVGPETAEGTDAEVANLTVTAHVLTDGGGVELHTLDLPITLSPESGGQVNATVRKEVLLVEAAKAREQALEAERRGDFAGGASTLRDSIASLKSAALWDAQIDEEIADLEQMASTFEGGSLTMSDIKYMKQRAYTTHRSMESQKERFRRTKDEEE